MINESDVPNDRDLLVEPGEPWKGVVSFDSNTAPFKHAETAAVATTREIDLLASLDEDWIKLPVAAMKDVGRAAQTLGGLLKLTNRETYVEVQKIAIAARLPLGTTRKHLQLLQEREWITNRGRGRTSRGIPRRSCTIMLSDKARMAMSRYVVLPWWACGPIEHVGLLPWGAKALLSAIMARLMAMKAAVQNGKGCGLNPEDLWGSMLKMGIEDRFRWSLSRIQRETGLKSRRSAVAAKLLLQRLEIIECFGDRGADGRHLTDCLTPNEAFRVAATHYSEKVSVAFCVHDRAVQMGLGG